MKRIPFTAAKIALMYSEFTGGNEKYTHVYEKFLLNVFQVDK